MFEGGASFAGQIYFAPGTGGTATNPVTLTSYGAGKAIVDAGAGSGGFFAWNAAGIDIQNLIFRGGSFKANTANSVGILFYNDLPGNVRLARIHLNNVEVYGFGALSIGGIDSAGYPVRRGGDGLSIGAYNGLSGFTDIQISNSMIHDNEGNGIIMWGPDAIVLRNVHISASEFYLNTGRSTSPDSSQFSGSGLVLYNVTSALVENCRSHDNGASGNGTAGIMVMASDHVIVQNNQSYQNRAGGNSDGDGFDLDGATTDSLMQNNFSWGNDGAGYLFAQPPGFAAQARNVMRYNISENDGGPKNYGSLHIWNGGPGIDDIEIYNNVLYSNPASGGTTQLIAFVQNAATHLRVRNNIFMTTPAGKILFAPSGSPGSLFQNNDYWTGGGPIGVFWQGVSYTTVGGWNAATGQEAGRKLSVNPLFAAAGGGAAGYKLSANSPVVDQGAGFALPSYFAYANAPADYFGDPVPRGAAVDVGAHEAAPTSMALPVVNSFTAEPASIAAGGSATLAWTTANAAGVFISPGIGTVPVNGTISVSPAVATTYTVTATNAAGSVSKTVAVNVSVPNGPWTGTYYSLAPQYQFGTLLLTRSDKLINFNWGTASPGTSIPANYFAVRWTANLSFPATRAYAFTARTDDGMRVWIDGTLVLDRWIIQGPTTYAFSRTLSAGSHAIEVRYFERTGGAVAQLSWK